jgi:hypothetical protein
MTASWPRPFIGRAISTALGVSLVGGLSPATGAAQEEVALPFTTAGAWEGEFVFDGHYAFDAEPDEDGAFSVGVTEVQGNTAIFVDLVVAEDGTISGVMPVDLRWIKESAGAGPTGDPFHIVHDRVQEGELALSGDASSILATGELKETFRTLSEGKTIEEVSGNATRNVEWEFSALVLECTRAVAPLMSASGDSLVRSAMLPPELESRGTTFYNNLVAYLVIWPTQEASEELKSAAVDDVEQLADALQEQPTPSAGELVELIDAWHTMQAEIAALNECVTDGVFHTSQLDQQWLALMLQSALGRALDGADDYGAHQLIALWDVGKAEAVLYSELRSEFYDTLDAKLDAAIADGDAETIADIAAYAADNGYADMQAKADAAP